MRGQWSHDYEASNKLVRPPLPHQFIHMQESTLRGPKPASQGVLSGMQLTVRVTRRKPHGASRFVQAMSAWSVETRRAPSRH